MGSGFVFYSLIDNIVDRYFPILDGLNTELEAYGGAVFVRGRRAENIDRSTT